MHITFEFTQLESAMRYVLTQITHGGYQALNLEDMTIFQHALKNLSIYHANSDDAINTKDASLARRFIDSGRKNKIIPFIWKAVLLKAIDVFNQHRQRNAWGDFPCVSSLSFEIDLEADLRDIITHENFSSPLALSCGHVYESSTAVSLNQCCLCKVKVEKNDIHFLPHEGLTLLLNPPDLQTERQYQTAILYELSTLTQGYELLLQRLDLHHKSQLAWHDLCQQYSSEQERMLIGSLLVRAQPKILFNLAREFPDLITQALVEQIRANYSLRQQQLYTGLISRIMHDIKNLFMSEGFRMHAIIYIGVFAVMSASKLKNSVKDFPVMVATLIGIVTILFLVPVLVHFFDIVTVIKEWVACRQLAAHLAQFQQEIDHRSTSSFEDGSSVFFSSPRAHVDDNRQKQDNLQIYIEC